MKTGFSGTFVISWAQTEVDGLAAAPRSALGVGASWRWRGEAVRVDGPQDVLYLDHAAGEAELHRRAGRKVHRLVGQEAGRRSDLRPGTGFDDPLFALGFEVTDGYDSYLVTLVEQDEGAAPLVMFPGTLPPAETDLWVVRTHLEHAEVNRFTDQPTAVICFTPGTRIRTAAGEVAVEDIREGDRVATKDDGPQEVLWIGRKRITGARLYAMPELRPIRLRTGALGVERPDGDLVVSPGHRMLVTGAKARALFNTDEVLVRARDLIDDSRVTRDHACTEVTYVHLLLPRHEVVFANGLETESFHPGTRALDSLAPDARAHLLGLLPGLGDDPAAYGDHARRVLSHAEAAIMAYDGA